MALLKASGAMVEENSFFLLWVPLARPIKTVSNL